MLLIPDIQDIQPDMVISNGVVIAKHGRLLVPPRVHTFQEKNLNTIRLTAAMGPEDFAIRGVPGATKAKLRVVDMVTDLVTKETVMEMNIENGAIHADPHRDILKVAAVDRTIFPGKTFTGLIHGFRLRAGAMACSAGWDTTDIVVVGANDADMALAVNRIAELRGGAVLCRDGKVLEELAMPLFGIMSPLPLKDIDERLAAITSEAAGLGIPFADPILSLITLSGAAIPFLRICEEGLVNLKTGKKMGLLA
jgi:adenine deaminase